MAELTNRNEREKELSDLVRQMNDDHAEELRRYLAHGIKRLTDVPAKFWDKVKKSIQHNRDVITLLLLIFNETAEQHIPGITETSGFQAVAKKYVTGRLGQIAPGFVARSKQMLGNAVNQFKRIQHVPQQADQFYQEALRRIFGRSRSETIAETEGNLAMVNGGEAAIRSAGIRVMRFWAHSRLRPPKHSNAEKQPCKICSPREGTGEADWGGLQPGHAHPNCDCFPQYLDEYGNLIGDDTLDSDTLERYRSRLPAGFLRRPEDLYNDHPDILESYDESKHPRGQPGNAGEYGPGDGSSTKTAAKKKQEKNTKTDDDEESSTGRFAKAPATRGEMLSAKRVGKGKDSKIVLDDGKDAPEHVQNILGKIPEGWTDVRVASDPQSDVLATGKDGNGTAKTVYSDGFESRNKAIKFVRASDLLSNHDQIQDEFQRDRRDPVTKENADVSWLMLEQGTRPGSEADNKGIKKYFGHQLSPDDVVETKSNDPKIVIFGKQTEAQKKAADSGKPVVAIRVGDQLLVIKDQKTKDEILKRKASGGDLHDSGFWLKAHGATTLEGRHIVQAADGTRLQFVGKEGVFHDHLIKNPAVAKMLVDRKKSKGEQSQLFDTNETKVRDYVSQRDGGDFLTKDLRTARANIIALKEIQDTPAPTTEKQFRESRNLIAERVSNVLGNKPAQALESYINPEVFSGWMAGLKSA